MSSLTLERIREDDSSSSKNDDMLAALRNISERSKNMSVSADKETAKLIREARSGGIFNNEPDSEQSQKADFTKYFGD